MVTPVLLVHQDQKVHAVESAPLVLLVTTDQKDLLVQLVIQVPVILNPVLEENLVPMDNPDLKVKLAKTV
jgi:hypothetical protein